jgi:hypothetical protein
VVIDPDTLSDGRLVHAECKKRLTQAVPKPRTPDDHPKSGSRIKAALRKRAG